MDLWKEIYKEAYYIKLHSSRKIRDGSRVQFWEDVWCSEEPFSELFPPLYVLAGIGSKGASVKDVWRPVGEQGGWDLHFERHFND